MTRVFIAAADSALRNALRLILPARLPVKIVGEAANRKEFEPGIRQMRPELILVDWALPEFRDLGCLANCHALLPHSCVVVLSVTGEEAASVLAAGAHACLGRGASPDSLLAVLQPFT